MRPTWNRIRAEHVERAVEYIRSGEILPRPSRSLFLVHEDKDYPLKHVAKLAYQIANNLAVDEWFDFTSGAKLVEQFQQLGFTVIRKQNRR